MAMDWPMAFVFAVMVVSVFAYMAWDNHMRAEIIKEAIRKGWPHVEIE